MNKYYVFILAILLMCFFTTKAQYHLSFCKLGSNEMLWVVAHPFVAKKAKKISALSIHLSDSISKVEGFPNVKGGGEKDALRHGLWMALLTKHIGSKKALKLGAAHERTNEKDFKRNKLEEGSEGSIPDSKAGEMDAFNNQRASKIAESCQSTSNDSTVIDIILKALYKGKFKIIKMDWQGNSLDRENKIIPDNEWEGKWINNQQLVPSNYLLKS